MLKWQFKRTESGHDLLHLMVHLEKWENQEVKLVILARTLLNTSQLKQHNNEYANIRNTKLNGCCTVLWITIITNSLV